MGGVPVPAAKSSHAAATKRNLQTNRELAGQAGKGLNTWFNVR
jgi:hypothetical protein